MKKVMNKRIQCIPFPEIENAFVVISGQKADNCNGVKSCMSFFYANKEIGAEWEPNYGPITVIYKCKKEDEQAEKHWFYDYCTGYGNWSQLAVNEEGLGNMFITGNYIGIFGVLKRWANK